jgi:DNA-binding transcriptional LysR family regulator
MPDLDALALLIAVAESGSLGRAATRFGITQPAASLRIRTLERGLGIVLLNRTPTGSTLTVPGRQVVEWARPVIQSAADFGRKAALLTRSGQEQLRIAASLTVADHLLPGWLAALHAALPGVRVALRPANSEHVVELITAGEADLGFVEGAEAPIGVRSQVVADDDLILVVSPAHPWARRRAGVTSEELATGSLVLREPGSGTREVLDRALAGHGLSVRPSLEFGSTESIKSTVERGTEGAVLSLLAVRNELEAGVLVAVPTPDLDLRRRLRAVWREGRKPAGAAGTLLALALGRSR